MNKSSKQNILIIGGNFIGKGAEAMMFTLKDVINSVLPDASIYVVSVYPEERELLLSNGFIPLRRKRIHVLKKLFLLIKVMLFKRNKTIRPADSDIALTNVYSVSDIVVDISGFASGDQWGWRKALNRFLDYWIAKYSGNKIVFMPQSWGPFKNIRVRLLTKYMLKVADLVFAREKLSEEYLLQNNCVNPDKLFFSTDIAFNFKPEKHEEVKTILERIFKNNFDGQNIVAITPNIRIYQRTDGEGLNNSYIKGLIQIINFFLNNTDVNILLIPHEFFKNENDVKLCNMITESFSNSSRIFTTPSELKASEVKGIIGQCELIIASRYHSLVFALSMSVVPVVVGWAHKYDELLKFLNLEKLVVDPVNRDQENLLQIVENAWANRVSIKNDIDKKIPEIKEISGSAIKKLKNILENIN